MTAVAVLACERDRGEDGACRDGDGVPTGGGSILGCEGSGCGHGTERRARRRRVGNGRVYALRHGLRWAICTKVDHGVV